MCTLSYPQILVIQVHIHFHQVYASSFTGTMSQISTSGTTNSATVQVLQALGGGVSGAFTRFITQPFDVLKIRFQLQVEPLRKSSGGGSKYHGMIQAIRSIYVEEGIRGMWKGHMHGQLMSVSYAIVQFWSYEQLRTRAHNITFFHDRPHLTYFVCGGIAGSLGTIVAQPFDVVRTRVVAADPKSATSQLSAWTGVFKVFKADGLRGVSSGLLLTLLQIYPLVGANFLIYKTLNEIAITVGEKISGMPNQSQKIPGVMLFINGGISGIVAKMLIYPADVIKKRYMLSFFTQDRTQFGKNPECSNLKRCIMSTYSHEGLRGFYKGMMPTLYKSGVMSACYFTVYDYYNKSITQPYKRREKEREEALLRQYPKTSKTSW